MHTPRARLAASLLGLAGLLASAAASAAVIYNEATDGDLSNAPAAPTSVGTLALGTSTVSGRLQILRPEDGTDDAQDFFRFVVAAGTQVSAITLDFSAIGYRQGAGIALALDPAGATPGSTLGSLNTVSIGLFSGDDLLGPFGYNLGGPLLAGSYTFALDGVGAAFGLASYAFNFTVVDPNPPTVPEPASGLLVAGSLLALAATRRRRT